MSDLNLGWLLLPAQRDLHFFASDRNAACGTAIAATLADAEVAQGAGFADKCWLCEQLRNGGTA
jgi:hypothetical protein